MKKILVFGITENPGGVESVIMNYYRKIDKDKFQFDFLCNTEEVAYEDEILALGGKIYRITARSANRKKYKKELIEFYEKHAKEYNAIWVNVCSLANIDYLRYAKKYGIRYRIIHSHNSQNMDSKLRGVLHKLNKLVIKKYATDFWACSDEAGKWFYNKNIMNSDKYLVINNAINTKTFMYNEKIRKEYRKRLNIENKFVIGNVGRLHFQKNQKFIIDIFNELCKKNDNYKLLLVGQGEDEEELKNKVKMLNLESKVIFLGVRQDVQNILQAMDIFLFPSIFEGLPVTLIEAEASGIEILTSTEAFPQNTKLNKLTSRLSLNDNINEWAEKLEIISNELHKENRLDKSKSNIAVIKKSGYDIEIQTKKLQDFFINI